MPNFGKRVNNLLTKLRVDENSILFAKGETLDDKTVKNISKSKYSKDIVLYNLNILKTERKKKTLKLKNFSLILPLFKNDLQLKVGICSIL